MPVRVIMTTEENAGASSAGGSPRLPRGRYPRCAHCDAKMVLFFQVELDDAMGVPFRAGSMLTAMMCPTHNEALLHPIEWRSGETVRLPEAFWNDQPLWHVFFQLVPPGIETKTHAADPFLVPHALRFEPFEETTAPFEDTGMPSGAQGFKIGGAPAYYQHARRYFCACGSEMSFVLQLPPNRVFPKRSEAPEQPGTPDAKGYVFTLGNQLHLYACRATCHTRALWGVNQ